MTLNKAHYDAKRTALLVAAAGLNEPFTYNDVFEARPDQWVSYSFCTTEVRDWLVCGLIERVPHPEGKQRPHFFRWVE